MFKKIGTDDMRKKMGEILDCVNLRGDEFIIERKHQPVAGLIPINKMNAFKDMAKSFLLDFLAENETALTDEEVEQIADLAKHHTRKQKRSE